MSYEAQLKERVREVKRRIYDSPAAIAPVAPDTPRAIDPATFMVRQRVDRNADWVLAMHRDRRPRIITLEVIKRVICKHFRISHIQLTGPSRTREYARARQIGMWLARELTARSLPQIGKAFGGRDHTTVLHALNRVEQYIAENEDDIPFHIEVLTKQIYEAA